MKIKYRYFLLVFALPFVLMFDRYMYPFFKTQRMTHLEIGIIDAVFSASTLIFLYYWGHVSDRIGRKKALAGFLAYYAPFSLLYLKVSNFLQGLLLRITESPSYPKFPTETAYYQDLAPKNRKATFFGILTAIGGLGSFLVPIIGGFLIDSFGFYILGLTSFLIILLVIFIILILPEPSKHKKNKKIRSKINFKILRSNKFLKAFSIYYFLTGISFVIVWIWIPFLSMKVTESYGIIGIIISAASLFAVFGRIPFGYLADKYGKVGAFIFAGIMSPLSIFFLAISNSVLTLIISSLLASLAVSVRLPAEGAILSDNIKPKIRGGIFNAFEFISRVGVIIGGLVGGMVVMLFGASIAFIVAALVSTFAIITFIYALRHFK